MGVAVGDGVPAGVAGGAVGPPGETGPAGVTGVAGRPVALGVGTGVCVGQAVIVNSMSGDGALGRPARSPEVGVSVDDGEPGPAVAAPSTTTANTEQTPMSAAATTRVVEPRPAGEPRPAADAGNETAR